MDSLERELHEIIAAKRREITSQEPWKPESTPSGHYLSLEPNDPA